MIQLIIGPLQFSNTALKRLLRISADSVDLSVKGRYLLGELLSLFRCFGNGLLIMFLAVLPIVGLEFALKLKVAEGFLEGGDF